MEDTIGGIFIIILIIMVWGDTVLKHATHFMYDLQGFTRPVVKIRTVETEDDLVQIKEEPEKEEEVVFKLSDETTWGSFDEDEFMKHLEQTVREEDQ